jgi:hypothetical protein
MGDAMGPRIVETTSTRQSVEQRAKSWAAFAREFRNLDIIEVEYKKIAWLFQRTLIMHKLAKNYFGVRAFWFTFLPLTLVSTATTILGFLSTGGDFDSVGAGLGLDDSRGAISVTIGLLGAAATLLTTLGKYYGYQSNYDMHVSAVKALERLIKQRSRQCSNRATPRSHRRSSKHSLYWNSCFHGTTVNFS